MNIIKISALCMGIFFTFMVSAQDMVYVDTNTNIEEVATSNTEAMSIEMQQMATLSDIRNYLSASLQYPNAAKQEVLEGQVRIAILLNDDMTNAELHIGDAKGNALEEAVIQAFDKEDILNLIPENYLGSKVFPVDILFQMDLED